MRYLLGAAGVIAVVVLGFLQATASNFTGSVTFVTGAASGTCTTSIADDFSGDESNWLELSGSWVIDTGGYVSNTAEVSIYVDEQTCTVSQWVMMKMDISAGNYFGFYFRSENDATTYAYAVRYEDPNDRFVWRYCGGADHSNDPDQCTTVDSGAATWDRTGSLLDSGDFVGVDVSGTGSSTEVKIYDLGTTAKSYANWASSADAFTTLTNNPGTGAADIGKYLGVYNGAADAVRLDDFSGGSY